MNIKYKSIIKDIIGPEASKRGFVYSSGRRMITTKPLAYYDRIIDGKKQGFGIIQYLLDDGLLFFRGCGMEKRYHYTDENSFKECIYEIEDYLEKEGYLKLDSDLNEEYFILEDCVYVEENYETLAKEYISSRNLLQVDAKDAIDIISNDLEKTFGIEWSNAKDRLIELSAALTVAMLYFFPDTCITRHDNAEYYFVEKIKGTSIVACEAPLQLIYDAYSEHDCEKWLKHYIEAYYK